MSEPTDLSTVTAAYGSWAPAYIDAFGSADLATPEDRAVIDDWARDLHARDVGGTMLDAGCGPGHWSAFLHERGLAVEGVDATPELLAHATSTFPGIPFRLADLRSLALPAGSLGGVLAWYSLIHIGPEEVRAALRDLAGALRPGGGLLIGFFAGDRLEPFDHRVVTGWTWPIATMTAALEAAGLVVTSSSEHLAPTGRRNAAIRADRPAAT